MSSEKTIIRCETRAEWRNWLLHHFNKESEVWLVFPKKSSGKQRIPYNDAVEEALCFGWIDSINKNLDIDHSMQRFSPRMPKSKYSQANIERLKWLAGKEMIHPELVNTVKQIINTEFIFPSDIMAAIKNDTVAWNNYQAFPDSYKRIRIAYIDSARNRPEKFTKRLSNFIAKSHQNMLIKGFGGIEKYY